MDHERAGASGKRIPTGIGGFDEIVDGGLPAHGVTVVLGGAGAGKTIFGMQVLAEGARRGEAGVLVAFEESAEQILDNTANFTWGGAGLREKGLEILDAQISQAVEQGGDFDLVGLLAIVGAKAEQVRARRVVFDGLDVLLGYLSDPALIRRELFRVREWVHERKLSAIVTAKADAAEARPADSYDFLQFMADCVVTMHHRVVEGMALRFIRVAKYRGAAHSANEFPVTITSAGLEVAGSAALELVHRAPNERVSTGVERLDAMLSGGVYRGSSVLITGVPGTAKTSLATAFADAAARRGERTLYVSFDESPEQIIRNMRSIGIQLAPHVEAGVLRVHSIRAQTESPEVHVARIRAMLREFRPQNLIIDPLSALTKRGSESDADAAALQVLDLAKGAGLTLVSTSLLGNSMPLVEHTPLNISTLSDTWLHVTYVSQAGERNRAITIIKSRGMGHSNQVRELVLTDAGVTLADVYAVDGDVLMGTLRWERENAVRRAKAAALHTAKLREQKAELALAETKARLDTLARERAIQEAELEQLRADGTMEAGDRAHELDERLQRRHADPATTSPPPHRETSAESTSRGAS